MSWKAVKIATFSDGVSAITALSAASLGSAESCKLCKRSARPASASRSLRRSVTNRSLNSFDETVSVRVGQRFVNQVGAEKRIVLAGQANQVPYDVRRRHGPCVPR